MLEELSAPHKNDGRKSKRNGHKDDVVRGNEPELPKDYARDACEKSHGGRKDVPGFSYLLNENHDEHGSEGKINSLKILLHVEILQHGTRDRPDYPSENPVDMVQKSDASVEGTCRSVLRQINSGKDGVGLVGEGKNQVRLPLSRLFEFGDERKSVDNVAYVHEKLGYRNLRYGESRRKKSHGHVLTRPRVNYDAHKGCNPPGVPSRNDVDSERDSDGDVPEENGYGDFKGLLEKIPVHFRFCHSSMEICATSSHSGTETKTASVNPLASIRVKASLFLHFTARTKGLSSSSITSAL